MDIIWNRYSDILFEKSHNISIDNFCSLFTLVVFISNIGHL